jgi:hypothetical protein
MNTSAEVAAPLLSECELSCFMRCLSCRRGQFSTAELATHFSLTLEETRAALNEYAAKGLVSFIEPLPGVERWTASRDGRFAFADGRRTFTRTTVEALKIHLTHLNVDAIAAELLELSMGGRLVNGDYDAKPLIGVRLRYEPTSLTLQFMARLASNLARILQSHDFVILVYRNDVPERLKRRWILKGSNAGHVEDTPSDMLDMNESLALRRQMDLLGPRIVAMIRTGMFDSLDALIRVLETSLPRDLILSTAKDVDDSDAPIQCVPSPHTEEDALDREAIKHALRVLEAFR